MFARKPFIYRNTMHYFSRSKSAIDRKSASGQPQKWRIGSRPIRTVKDRVSGVFIIHKQLPAENIARPNAWPERGIPRGNGTTEHISIKPFAAGLEAARPTGLSSYQGATSAAAKPNLSKSELSFHPRGSLVFRSVSMQDRGPTPGAMDEYETLKAVGVQGNRPDASLTISHPKQHKFANWPMVEAATSNFSGLHNSGTVRRDRVPEHSRLKVELDLSGLHEAGIPDEKGQSKVKLATPMERSSISQKKLPSTMPAAPGLSILERSYDTTSKRSVSSVSSPMRAASVSTSSIQSSGVSGELWLDTLSLRDWLHAYLTNEIGRASRTVNHMADSLTNM
jgi:hypothetical protein